MGNTDLKLGKKIVGNIYTKQVGYLMGLIAFYRTDNNEKLKQNS